MKYICTYCSRKKSDFPRLIPAKERYSSDWVRNIEKIAKEKELPLLFISGKYGLIQAEELIPLYNLRFTDSLVPSIVKKSVGQVKKLNVTELIFYTKPQDEKLRPYYDVIKQICNQTGIKLSLVTLAE